VLILSMKRIQRLQEATAGDTPNFVKVYQLETLRKKALRNARRQKAAVELGKDVRVSHTFWEQVARDYARQIDDAIFQSNQLLRFNINDHILVKLSPSGKAHWKKNFEKWQDVRMKREYPFEEHFARYTRKDGYTEFQLWTLMEIFGPVTGQSSNHFETTVFFRKTEMHADDRN
jgi:hypothetical protein